MPAEAQRLRVQVVDTQASRGIAAWPPPDGSGSRVCTVMRGGSQRHAAPTTQASGALPSTTTAINADTIRISFSQCAAYVGADDLPLAAVVDELELEAVEVGLDAVRSASAPDRWPSHARMHDGARRVRALEHDLVDAAHDLDSLVGDEVAAQHAQSARRGRCRACRGSRRRATLAEEPDIARLGRLLRRCEQRADLGFRIAGARNPRREHGGESGGRCQALSWPRL